MRTPQNNRLDRIALLVEVNAKAIEAMRIELRDGISETIGIMTQLAEEAYQERIELKQRQEAADKRFETLLAEVQADRADMREANQRSDQKHEAANQRFDHLLAEAQADRDRNAQVQEEFRQVVRALLERNH